MGHLVFKECLKFLTFLSFLENFFFNLIVSNSLCGCEIIVRVSKVCKLAEIFVFERIAITIKNQFIVIDKLTCSIPTASSEGPITSLGLSRVHPDSQIERVRVGEVLDVIQLQLWPKNLRRYQTSSPNLNPKCRVVENS